MLWENVNRFDSSEGSVSKYVYERNDAIAESVLYRYPTFEERTVICCSTQSGCPVGCTFCGTGKRFIRNLSSDEIVEQISHAFHDSGVVPGRVKKLQIMFMSMGEPMLNFKNVSDAIIKLSKDYKSADLLISTMAPTRSNFEYEDLIALSCNIPKVGIQFSIHESTDAARNRIIPFRSKLSLAEIAQVGRSWSTATGRYPFFNYCVHSENSSSINADQLEKLFSPTTWKATVSVVCEKDESVKSSHNRQRKLANEFAGRLLFRGYDVRTFDPAGQDDIGGGCGQLWFTQKWLKNKNFLNGAK